MSKVQDLKYAWEKMNDRELLELVIKVRGNDNDKKESESSQGSNQ
jgi:hypothetical protein